MEHGKSEGENPDWDYVPPEGMILVDHDIDGGDFDWDAVNNDEDYELWLVRAPEGLRTKYLENLSIDLPSSSQSAIVGVMHSKHMSYDVRSFQDHNEQSVGEEIRGVSCLLPKKRKKGKLYKAPKSIARHIVISAQDVLPNSDSSVTAASDSSRTYQNTPRPSYAKGLLKHRFMPYGYLVGNNEDINDTGGVDVEMKVAEAEGGEMELTKRSKESKAKKRKVEEDSPKKSKKAKTDM